jgi:hypothetical protein
MTIPNGAPQGEGVWVLNIPAAGGGSIPVSPGGAPAGFYTSLQQEALVAIAAAGDTAVIAGVAGKVIYVTGYNVTATSAANIEFKTSSGAAISAQGIGVLSGNEAAGGPEPFLFRTVAGDGLTVNFSAGNPGTCQVRYRQF